MRGVTPSIDLLVIGASGFLGDQVLRVAVRRYRAIAAASRLATAGATAGSVGGQVRTLRLDVTAADCGTVIRELAPAAILNLAAVNPGGGGEAAMLATNADGAGAVARAASELKARLIHVSTDCVHGGDRAPYGDDDPAAPVNAYGRSKALGEERVLAACPGALVVRTSLIYAPQTEDRVTRDFRGRLARGEVPGLYADVIRQPVAAADLAAALLDLISTGASGRLNVAGEEAMSRARFGRLLLAHFQVPGRDRVTETRAAGLTPPIPLDLRLTIARATALLGRVLPGPTAVLEGRESQTDAGR